MAKIRGYYICFPVGAVLSQVEYLAGIENVQRVECLLDGVHCFQRAAALFLSSEASSFITGETIKVAGGYPLHI